MKHHQKKEEIVKAQNVDSSIEADENKLAANEQNAGSSKENKQPHPLTPDPTLYTRRTREETY